MSLPSTIDKIAEYRGVTDLVAAELLTDTAEEITYDTPFAVAGVAQIVKDTANSSEAHYYNNGPAVIIETTGEDTLTIDASALPLDVSAKLTGQVYNENLGAMFEGQRKKRLFAIGYKTKTTDGESIWVWRLKCSFNVPSVTNATEDNGTGANGQQLVATCIQTIHKFENVPDENGDPSPGKSTIVNVSKNLADVSAFFTAVTTPDDLVGKTAYKLTKTQGSGTVLSVKRAGVELANNANIYAGDRLLITTSTGSITVNGTAFISGDIHVVTGATTVVSAS